MMASSLRFILMYVFNSCIFFVLPVYLFLKALIFHRFHRVEGELRILSTLYHHSPTGPESRTRAWTNTAIRQGLGPHLLVDALLSSGG